MPPARQAPVRMHAIPDFTDNELWILRSTLKERYGRDVEIRLAEAELRLEPDAREVTPCPAVFWSERGANFVIAKSGESRYRCQFYYRGFQQYGTGRDEYDELATCAVTLLQVQADHEHKSAARPSAPEG
jgi:hypothetical protein